MNKINELYEEKGRLYRAQNALLDATYEGTKVVRSFTPEEAEKYDKMEADLDSLDRKIESFEAHEARIRKAEERTARMNDGGKPAYLEDPSGSENEGKPASLRASQGYRDMFSSFLRIGHKAIGDYQHRDVQVDLDASGGFLLLPEQFMTELIRNIDDATVMRQVSRVLPPLETAGSLGVPVVESGADDAEWTTELATGKDDTSLKFGKRSFTPHFIRKRIRVSKEFSRRFQNIDTFVNDEFARVVAATQENAFMNANGDGRPLGVFYPSDAGIPTSRDMATDNTSTALTAEGLINAKYSLKTPYAANSRWIFHRDIMKEVRKIKTANGDFVWMPGLATDRPDTILDVPVILSEYAPKKMETKKYVGIIGDFRHYWIVDSMDMDVQFIDQLYAEQNLNVYILQAAVDGMPTRAEAFTRVKLA